ncbi:hypothetical protein EDC22_10711 [Tepidamorphus gemmatus]|uniref:Succinoglycan biosynthesis protein ExoI n=1 Tax=Tepidamorphus gemmatus TaxID=747076 RepID=A0A4R3MCH2_9HYPH|nr:hypothetical protein [Tepidamorphus gemmatus]TCT09165.1 hypothetical protein EDC22_10711 [Tepidamorphus gemmatus]
MTRPTSSRIGTPAFSTAIALATVAAGTAALAALTVEPRLMAFARDWAGSFGLIPGCNIKGNIAANGQRIYHVPGQEYYAATQVDLARGERWFCSESDARAAGWRRAKI